MPSPSMTLPIHLAHDDVDAAQDDDDVGDVVAEAHVFENGEIDELGGRTR